MKEIIDGLNTRLNIASRADSDLEFYQSLYHYYEYIHKTHELKTLWEESEIQYRKKHIQIWEKRPMTDSEADEASSKTHKMERFDLFAAGSLAEARIYLPIDDYKNTNEPDEEQDPVAVILIKGLKYAKTLKGFRWDHKKLDSLNRWFDGKRNEYEAGLRRFHLLLLDELAKLKVVTNFYFNSKTGDFKYLETKGTLAIKSKEYVFLNSLYSSPNHQATYKELLGTDEVTKLSKITLTDTVKVLKRKLLILPKNKHSNPDIIKSVAKQGYKLNI